MKPGLFAIAQRPIHGIEHVVDLLITRILTFARMDQYLERTYPERYAAANVVIGNLSI